ASSPNFRVLYNIAQLSVETGDAAGAVHAYEQYLKDGGANVPAKRRADVQRELDILMEGVERVTVRCEPGAEIAVDDIPIGSTPLAKPLLVNTGTHRLTAKKPGFASAETTIDAMGGNQSTTSFDLVALPSAPAQPAEAPSTPLGSDSGDRGDQGDHGGGTAI